MQIVRLAMPAAFGFDAGQYLEVVHPDGTAIPLSIASPPEALPALELHYRATPGLPEAERMDELLAAREPLALSGPHGTVRLSPADARSLLLVAAGTGCAQALSLAEAQTRRHPTSHVHVLACAESPQNHYYRDMLPVSAFFSAILIGDPRRGPENLALSWLSRQSPPGSTRRAILSGPPAFVHAATATLAAAGWPTQALESDVYDYAPA